MCLGTKNLEHRGKAYFSISFSFPLVEGGPLVICLPAFQWCVHMASRLHGCLSPPCQRSPRAGRGRCVMCRDQGTPLESVTIQVEWWRGGRGWDKVTSGAQRGPSPE